MDRGIFAARVKQANDQIATSVKELAELFPELDDDRLAMENAGSHVREPAYKSLFRAEALAVILQKLVALAKGEAEPEIELEPEAEPEAEATGESEEGTGETEDGVAAPEPSAPDEPPAKRAPVRVQRRG